jgi:hypothetical protein
MNYHFQIFYLYQYNPSNTILIKNKLIIQLQNFPYHTFLLIKGNLIKLNKSAK